jgi:hypothetical protein
MKDTNMSGGVLGLVNIIEFTDRVIKAIENHDSENFSKDLVLYLLNEIKTNEIHKIELYGKEFIQHK